MPYIVLDPSAAEAAPSTTAGEPLTSTGKTLASMRTMVRTMMGGRSDITSAQIDEVINNAYIDIATSTEGKTASLLLQTVAGQPLYLLPAVVANIQSISLVDDTLPEGGKKLDKKDKSYYRDKPVVDDDVPSFYFREGNLLVLYPTPDAVYDMAVDFRIRPIRLTDDTHSPILDDEWHETIELNARHKLFSILQEFDKTPQTNNEVTDLVRRRKGEEEGEDENKLIRSSVPHRDPRYVGYGYPVHVTREL